MGPPQPVESEVSGVVVSVIDTLALCVASTPLRSVDRYESVCDPKVDMMGTAKAGPTALYVTQGAPSSE